MLPEPVVRFASTSAVNLEAILTFAGGVAITLITTFAGNSIRKARAKQHAAEGDASLAEVTLKWATQLRDDLEKAKLNTETRLTEMASRVTVLEKENELYRRYNGLLIEQVMDAGLTPVARPTVPDRSPSGSGGVR